MKVEKKKNILTSKKYFLISPAQVNHLSYTRHESWKRFSSDIVDRALKKKKMCHLCQNGGSSSRC